MRLSRKVTTVITALPTFLLACSDGSGSTGVGHGPSPDATSRDAFATAEWSLPVNMGAPINSAARDQNPSLSNDGLTLYFASDRPGSRQMDIYVVHREAVGAAWGDPINLSAINSDYVDQAPNVSPDGHLLFFLSDRPDGEGSADIYVSVRQNPNDDFGWAPPVSVGPPVNTTEPETAPHFVEASELGTANLYFSRGPQVPPGTAPWAEIFVGSVSRATGKAFGTVTRVEELNSDNNDASPTVRRDGREIFFWSSRPGSFGNDIWTSTRPSVHDPWSTPVRLPDYINSAVPGAQNDNGTSLSFDGRTLLFVSNRPGGFGLLDIWMTTRTPNGQE